MMGSAEDELNAYHLPRPLPIWLNPAYAKHIVKGNFMTLSARPKTVEQGEWVAHQGTSCLESFNLAGPHSLLGLSRGALP